MGDRVRPALYVKYNRCADSPKHSFAGFADAVMAAAEDPAVTRIIVDVRHNGGGNSEVFRPLVPRLREWAADDPGRVLVAVIGRGTFSSGQMNAADLRKIGAVVVGEPTGQKPNAFGEIKTFTLPRSGLTVRYSTKRFETDPSDPPSMMPDVAVGSLSTDFFAGRDPVLDAALSAAPPK